MSSSNNIETLISKSNINLKEEIFSSTNFKLDKFFEEKLEKVDFSFKEKSKIIKIIKNIITENKLKYNQTFEQVIEVLINSYKTFMSIGTYVNEIDISISELMINEKNYSNLIQSLRKDVEESLVQFRNLKEEEETQSSSQKDSVSEGVYFEKTPSFYDYLDDLYYDDTLKMTDFLNPPSKSKRWLQEVSEMIKVYVDEGSFEKGVKVILEVKESDMALIDYNEKIKIDDSYNYFIEKLTLECSKSNSILDINTYIGYLIDIKCDSLGRYTYLDWISKILKSRITVLLQSQSDSDDDKTKTKTINAVDMIKLLVTSYNQSMNYYLNEYRKFFGEDDSINENILLLDWKKRETSSFYLSIQAQFSNVKTIKELKTILKFYKDLIDESDSLGLSVQYVLDEFILKNLNISLEAISSICMKEKGSPYEIQEYSIDFSDKHMINSVLSSTTTRKVTYIENETIKKKEYVFTCCSQLGNCFVNILQLIVEFISGFGLSQNIYFVKYLDDYFFSNILSNDLVSFISNKVNFAMSQNMKVNSFSDGIDDLPLPNQLLINYAISLTSITNTINEICKRQVSNKIYEFRNYLIDIHSKFFLDLFRQKLEWHFLKSANERKEILFKDSPHEFKSESESEPDASFLNFFYLLRTLVLNLRKRNVNEEIIEEIILDSQFIVFLNSIQKVVETEKSYDSEFSFGKIGIFGVEKIIIGVYFIKNSIEKVFNYKLSGKEKPESLIRKSTIKSFLTINNFQNLIGVVGVDRMVKTKGKTIESEIFDVDDSKVMVKHCNLVDMLLKNMIKKFCFNKKMSEDMFLSRLVKYEEIAVEYIIKNKYELDKK